MWVVVTLLAAKGSSMEIHVEKFAFQVRGTVAAHALYATMSTGEGKLGGCVIELRDIAPLLSAVARFTAESLSVVARNQHPRTKLAAMRIGVAGLAGQVREMIKSGLILLRLMTFIAGHGNMAAG